MQEGGERNGLNLCYTTNSPDFRMYANGHGVQQDYIQARQWYEKAAAQGNAEAQFGLGYMYENGMGVQQDKKTAKRYYSKACSLGLQQGCDYYQQTE